MPVNGFLKLTKTNVMFYVGKFADVTSSPLNKREWEIGQQDRPSDEVMIKSISGVTTQPFSLSISG